jgi:hypothetical protein
MRVTSTLMIDRSAIGISNPHCSARSAKAENPWRALEGAQHHDDPPVLAQVGDRLGARTDDVHVGDGGVVDNGERVDRALR